jgi:hypothetical protein
MQAYWTNFRGQFMAPLWAPGADLMSCFIMQAGYKQYVEEVNPENPYHHRLMLGMLCGGTLRTPASRSPSDEVGCSGQDVLSEPRTPIGVSSGSCLLHAV